MAVHFVSLEALGPEGSSAGKAMGEFYRSLERVEKEEADMFPQLACESSIANVQSYASALHRQYSALEELRGRMNERIDVLRTWLRAH